MQTCSEYFHETKTTNKIISLGFIKRERRWNGGGDRTHIMKSLLTFLHNGMGKIAYATKEFQLPPLKEWHMPGRCKDVSSFADARTRCTVNYLFRSREKSKISLHIALEIIELSSSTKSVSTTIKHIIRGNLLSAWRAKIHTFCIIIRLHCGDSGSLN